MKFSGDVRRNVTKFLMASFFLESGLLFMQEQKKT